MVNDLKKTYLIGVQLQLYNKIFDNVIIVIIITIDSITLST